MNELTPRHMDIYNYIRTYLQASGGISPTQMEIARRFRYAGVATIHGKLHDLKRHGLIDWLPKRERSIWLTQAQHNPSPKPTLLTSVGAMRLRLVPVQGVFA
jgi:SOS-response transcriptional repressor LexA